LEGVWGLGSGCFKVALGLHSLQPFGVWFQAFGVWVQDAVELYRVWVQDALGFGFKML
jgi:hypothetical protein